MTVSDLIKNSLRLIGAIASGETPSASEQADALSSLNSLLESWSAEGLMIFNNTREVFPFIPDQQSYTLGSGGNFDTIRPQQITQVGVEVFSTGGTKAELPVDLVNVQEWAAITVKETRSSIPSKVYAQGNYPLETLNFWPIPSVANNVVIYSLKPLTTFATSADIISMPNGYARALTYNLAVELAPEFGKDPSALVLNTAAESKATIMRYNIEPIYMQSDVMGLVSGKPFNWLTGN